MKRLPAPFIFLPVLFFFGLNRVQCIKWVQRIHTLHSAHRVELAEHAHHLFKEFHVLARELLELFQRRRICGA